MRFVISILVALMMASCSGKMEPMKKIIFLHHSTGYSVWLGKTNNYIYKVTKRGDVQKYIENFNKKNKTSYQITERFFPKSQPYGWNNYPFDYYNIWVKNAGIQPYMEEPTLEILSNDYDVIIFKHCFPVSNIISDSGKADINSSEKTIGNYILQYNALKKKLHQFPTNKFIIWTPAVNTQKLMSEEQAIRTMEFRDWIVNEWDEKGDNIFVWDFYSYETEGGLYLAEKNAAGPDNSHPNRRFSGKIAPVFAQFILDVIESKTE